MEEGNLRCLTRALVAFLVKLLSFFRIFGCRRERGLENNHPSGALVPAPESHSSVEAVKEDHVGPCLERLQKLELMFNELSCKPAEIPQEKERVLLDSWDRIKSIEFDLDKTKKVLQATVVKQTEIAEILEAVQESNCGIKKYH